MPLVTVYQAFNSADAHLIRSRLEAANLQATVANELASLTMEGYALTAGSILVQVPAEQAEEARELIRATNSPPE